MEEKTLTLEGENNVENQNNEENVLVTSVPTKLVATLFLENTDGKSEDEIKELANQMAEKFMENEKVRNILFNTSQEIAKEIGTGFLFVPGVILPVKDADDAKIVENFVNDYMKRINEGIDNGENK